LEQQTATAEVLGVINSSPGDLAPVFDAILEKAHRLCGAAHGSLGIFEGETWRAVVQRGYGEPLASRLRQPNRVSDNPLLQSLLDGAPLVHVADLTQIDLPIARANVEAGIRTLLVVALRKDDVVLGTISTARREVRPFSDKEIALLQNFAAQAVIAMENARLINETREALEQQTATSEVLQVINSSPGDLTPVFDAILEKAHSLCDIAQGSLELYDGEWFRAVAVRGLSDEFAEILRQGCPAADNPATQPLIEGRRFAHILDLAETDYTVTRSAAELDAARTLLCVPLRRDGALLGMIASARREVRPFSDKEIALLENFAAQAEIAMENARLINETREALEQQTATAEVLGVINSSPGDLTPVFEAILDKAHTLCGATLGSLFLFDGELFRAAATQGYPEDLAQRLRQGVILSATPQLLDDGVHWVHNPDLTLIDGPTARAVSGRGGVRTNLMLPLRKDGRLLGAISCYRQEVRPFTDKEIALLQNFAAQAVIAMENARLITETREALQQQTATAEVLQVINSSPGDLGPVFKAMLEKAHTLCGAASGALLTYDGEFFQAVAWHDLPEPFLDVVRQPFRHHPDNPMMRLVRGEGSIQVCDLTEAAPQFHREDRVGHAAAELGRFRTNLMVPLRKDGRLLGVITANRWEARPFSDKQIALLENFAAQAVIAMENARLITETREALDQQTATAEVLQVINSSPGDLAPVFDAMLDKATHLCEASFGTLWTYDGVSMHAAAIRGAPPRYAEFLRQGPHEPSPIAHQPLLRGERIVHIADIAAHAGYRSGMLLPHAVVELGGVRTLLAVPLRKEGQLLGVFSIYRQEVRPFSDKQLALLQNFADQAVIAMENARLLGELQARTSDLEESLEYQTATSDVLKVISQSGTEIDPVLQTLVETAARLCEADKAVLGHLTGGLYRMGASVGFTHGYKDYRARTPIPLDRGTAIGRMVIDRRVVHIEDALADPEYTDATARDLGQFRTVLSVPLFREETVIGGLFLARSRVQPFTEKQIALVSTFADQAVIAIENARLLSELQQRTDDLQESLEYQTATSDVLKVISRSTFDLQPVLDTLAETAARLCDAGYGAIYRRDGEVYRIATAVAFSSETKEAARRFQAFVEQHPLVPNRGSITGRVALERRAVHVADTASDPEYTLREATTLGNLRTQLGVPLLREGEPIGVIALARQRIEPFTERQVELVRTFADQAVIAIENARLLNELRERTDEVTRREAELRVTFDNMADGVVMFDADMRLAAWNRNFQQILHLPDAFLAERPSYADYFRYLAERGEFGAVDVDAELRRYEQNVGRQWSSERTRPDGRVIEVRNNPVPGGGLVLIYSDITERKEAEAKLRAARDAAEATLRELRAAQANLIHAEKMASLGQLTAGIAHEIKNPLNFVNNFAGLSVELLEELKETQAPAIAGLAADERGDVDEIVAMLTGNLEKIAEHGRRADGIVKSMLEHSRGGSGERREVDLNGLVEEALNLAYHGARAQDQKFNITLERDFDRALAAIELAPQEMTRVFLNLFGNGFYAATKRQRDGAEPDFRPTLNVTTFDLGEAVEIRIRDNGTGIPPEIRDKLFQPFFTTKPTGEGTGLGLSISWDIVTQQHGGTIEVDSRVGEFTEFTIRLPHARQVTPKEAAA
jgi:PAS domain S-box-containing protein